uniref:AB hydrolase-1 domain-containing protein n=1 Tax=Salix viminalis TaxID=40686 RepID=A0A6N2LSY7_SALVM
MICSCRSLQASALSFLLFFTSRRGRGRDMSCPNSLLSNPRKIATLRLSKVSGHTTELLEIQSDKPTCHVLFIPGNPGVVSFYKDFLESLYELLGATIGHISHTEKNWEHGKLFSLQDQIDHKVSSFLLYWISADCWLGWALIGSYISLEMLRSLEKVTYLIGLYPFLMLNPLSKQQSNIENVAESSILSALLSFSVATLGLLPQCTLRFMLSKSLGSSWSDTAIDAACSHLLQYHTFRNMLYMALMEFRKLSEMPDWAFMRENHEKIAFLFGVDDHWGPLQMFEEISKQAPGISLSIEREGHTHGFCCTEAGSEWVAHHVASLIKKKTSS